MADTPDASEDISAVSYRGWQGTTPGPLPTVSEWPLSHGLHREEVALRLLCAMVASGRCLHVHPSDDTIINSFLIADAFLAASKTGAK